MFCRGSRFSGQDACIFKLASVSAEPVLLGVPSLRM